MQNKTKIKKPFEHWREEVGDPKRRTVVTKTVVEGKVKSREEDILTCSICGARFMVITYTTEWDDGKTTIRKEGQGDFNLHVEFCTYRKALKEIKEKIGFNKKVRKVCHTCDDFISIGDEFYCGDLEEGESYCGKILRLLQDRGLDKRSADVEPHDSCDDWEEKEVEEND